MNSDIDTNSLLLARGVGGYGGGFGGGYGYGAGQGSFANPSANAVRIQEGNRATASSLENLLDQNQFAATNKNITDSNNRICDAVTSNALRQADLTAAAELRTADRMRDIEREMNANARTAADCCCDLKVQSCSDKSEILAAISAQGQAIVTRELAAANDALTSLRTQVACGCCTPS